MQPSAGGHKKRAHPTFFISPMLEHLSIAVRNSNENFRVFCIFRGGASYLCFICLSALIRGQELFGFRTGF